MAKRTTATEVYAKMQAVAVSSTIKSWVRKMEKTFSDNVLLDALDDATNMKQCKDWRPKDPYPQPEPKGDSISIRRPPQFTPPSSASSKK